MPLKDGAVNEILPFSSSTASPNVVRQDEYEALEARLGGFESWLASSRGLNKGWRKSGHVAGGGGEFLANGCEQGGWDDGVIVEQEGAIVAAVQKFFDAARHSPPPIANGGAGETGGKVGMVE